MKMAQEDPTLEWEPSVFRLHKNIDASIYRYTHIRSNRKGES